MIILETSRLYLKTIEKEDSEALHQMLFSDEETMQYAFHCKAMTLEESKKFIYKNFCKNNNNVGFATLFEKKSGLIIGTAGVLKNKLLGDNHYEIGFLIGKEYRKNGFATEIAQAQMTFIKKVLREKISYALIHKNDDISKKILAKIGMTFNKTIQTQDVGEKEIYCN